MYDEKKQAKQVDTYGFGKLATDVATTSTWAPQTKKILVH